MMSCSILFYVLNTNSNDLFLLPVDQVSRSYFSLLILTANQCFKFFILFYFVKRTDNCQQLFCFSLTSQEIIETLVHASYKCTKFYFLFLLQAAVL